MRRGQHSFKRRVGFEVEFVDARERTHLEARIDYLERLRDDLTSCIGCGCLSLATCRLQNRQDEVALEGPGARFLRPDA